MELLRLILPFRTMKKKLYRYLLLALAISIGIICFRHGTSTEESTPRSYDEIVRSGILRAVTEYNAVSYHVTDDSLGGIDYELLQAFATHQGLKLDVTPEMSFEKRTEGIFSGEYDLLATGTVINSRLKDTLLFTHPLLRSKQVLIQRKKATDADSIHFIGNQLQLANKKIHLVKGSPALLRIHHLIAEIADTIYTEEIEEYGPEQLLAMVSGGDIDYAVCDEAIAKESLHLFPNLDISTDIGFTQLYAWAVNKRSTALLDTLNQWIDRYTTSKDYKTLYNKYYKSNNP